MRPLSELFAEHRRGGVFRLAQPCPIRELENLVKAADWALFHLEGQGVKRKARFLSHAGLALRFPDYFGGNWDAFEDCLRDLSWVAARGYVIYFDHAEEFAASAPRHFATLLTILADAVEYWAAQGRPLFVLLHGADQAAWAAQDWT